LIFRVSTWVAPALVMGRPRIAAEVADACALLRSAGLFVAFFFAVTKFLINSDLTRFAKGAGIYQKNPNAPQKSLEILEP
jgi:hypothetical protein